MPRRALFLITVLVLALHWLVLSGVPPALGHPRGPVGEGVPTRRIAAPPPPPPPPEAPAPSTEAGADVALAAPAEAVSTVVEEALPTTAASPASAPAQTASAPLPSEATTGVDIAPPGAGTDHTPSAAPPPVRLPPPTRLAFDVSGQAKKFAYSARAELLWQHDGSRYEARQEISAFLVGSRTQRSVGAITAQGLLPEKFSDKSRSEQAAHFDYAKGRVTFS